MERSDAIKTLVNLWLGAQLDSALNKEHVAALEREFRDAMKTLGVSGEEIDATLEDLADE